MAKTHVILITGAGRGIGKAIAIEFAKRFSEKKTPLKLFLCSKTRQGIATTKAKCLKFGTIVDYFCTNLESVSNTLEMYSRCRRSLGIPTCVINNVGTGIFKDFREINIDDFNRVVSLNLKSLFFLTQCALTDMSNKKKGHIVFITSVAAEVPFEQSALYCLSKFGQKGLIEVLRLYGREVGVRITNVMPGATKTAMWKDLDGESQSQMILPQDVASVVVDAYLQPSRASIEEITIRHTSGDIQKK